MQTETKPTIIDALAEYTVDQLTDLAVIFESFVIEKNLAGDTRGALESAELAGIFQAALRLKSAKV